ncbi:MAG: NAD-dependent epimerase/dehydratase [Opitutaceae bacterium]|nr:NAD-dependent epimerase/dehydratase [Opitutaceae bacterium]
MPEQPHILVTGSTGNLGEKAVNTLKVSEVRVTRIGRNTNNLADVIPADLTAYDLKWAKYFEGVQTVLHLAADPKPVATWDSVQGLNIDLGLNVLRAAQLHGVQRFVFASSNWVLGGYRFTDTKLTSATPARPVNPYGASKLFFERVGIEQVHHSGMAFLSLRIGYCQPGDNQPGPHMAFGRWGQQMWLSNEDWAHAVECACLNPFEGAAVLNIMSDNKGMRWERSEALDAIGYIPKSRYTPRLGVWGAFKSLLAQMRDSVLPPMNGKRLFGTRW